MPSKLRIALAAAVWLVLVAAMLATVPDAPAVMH